LIFPLPSDMKTLSPSQFRLFHPNIFRLVLFTFISLLIACGGGEDKQQKLKDLKAKAEALQAEINQLETEICNSGEAIAERTVKVKTQILSPTAFQHYVEVQGKVDSEENVLVSPKASGIITRILVKKGEMVKKGQLIAQIEDESYKKGIDEVKTQLDLATTLYQKQKALWDQKIGTEVQFISAKATKESLEKRMATLEDQKSFCQVTAPISGVIDDVFPKTGEMAMAGMPLMRVVNLNNSKIVADLSEAYYTRIETGNEVICYFPDQHKEGRTTVRVKSQTIDAVSRTFHIETASPAGNDLVIRPNMVVEVKVKDYQKDNALILPLNLIQRDDKGEFVYVAQTEKGKPIARKTYVQLGMSYKGVTEVLSGIEENTEFISVGYQDLVEGQALEIIQ